MKGTYEKRIIVYADIIGWRNASNDISQFNRLYDTVKKIEGYAIKFSKEIKQKLRNTSGVSKKNVQEHSHIEFSFFSDNFAVSAPVDYGQMIFKIMAWMCHDLLREEFLVRGGVTIGDLTHYQGIIFGPALVEAVKLEQEKPHYPCLLCSNELGRYLEQTDYKNEVVLTDKYQKLVVNIGTYGSSYAEQDLMEIIEKNFSEAKKFTDKWQYLQEMLPRMFKNVRQSSINNGVKIKL